MIHVYAVTDRDPPAISRAGVDGIPVKTLVEGDLGAVYSRHDGAPSAPSAETALAHAGVCDALMDRGVDLLPVRYGTRYADEQALRAGIGDRRAWLLERLQQVRGHVELGLRVLWDDDAESTDHRQPVEEEDGRAYLLRRVEQEQRRRVRRAAARRAADRVHEPLVAASTDAREELLATPRLLLTAAYLVPRGDVGAFRDLVERLAAQTPELEILCTGPWPPYSFAEGVAEPGGST